MLDTFRISSAEQVPSECGQSRYIADIFHKDVSRRRKLMEASRLIKETRRL